MKRKKIHTKHGAMSANKLLERQPYAAYVNEWTTLLAKEHDLSDHLTERGVLIFRIGVEWLAFPAKVLQEVCETRPIHRIPHKVNTILRGLVNLRGQLRLCVNVQSLLQIKEEAQSNKATLIYRRLLAIKDHEQIWTFFVDEVYGIHHFDQHEIENVPVTVSKSTSNFLKGVVNWNNINVGLLDEELIFSCLQRMVN